MRPQGIDRAAETAHMEDVLTTAKALVDEGKIRAIGLSNESVWGAARWLHLADTLGLPRMASVQNEYSLLCRQFDTDWAEFSVIEDMPLLAFSPLAAGLLSGKYAGDVTPDHTRRSRTPDLGGRITPQVFPGRGGLSGHRCAAWAGSRARWRSPFAARRPFPTIPIIGATTLEQLQTNIGAADLALVGRGAGRDRRRASGPPDALLGLAARGRIRAHAPVRAGDNERAGRCGHSFQG